MPSTPDAGTDHHGNARGENARSRLLDAALQSFATKGFHGTGTRDIAEAAGMSAGGLYVHYPTKEELLYQLSARAHRHVLEVVEQAAAPAGAPAVRLRAVVRSYTAWHARFHVNARVAQYEIGALSPEHADEVARLRRRIELAVRGIVTAGVADGRFTVADVRITTLAILSLGIDVARWYRDDGPWSPEMIGNRYADLALGMVRSSG